MLIVFFDYNNVIHKELVPPEQTVNAKYYVDVLARLRKRVRMETAATWVFRHNNIPIQTASPMREFLMKYNLATLPQPPYSPDLPPAYYFLF